MPCADVIRFRSSAIFSRDSMFSRFLSPIASACCLASSPFSSYSRRIRRSRSLMERPCGEEEPSATGFPSSLMRSISSWRWYARLLRSRSKFIRWAARYACWSRAF